MKTEAGRWAAGEGSAPVQEAAPYPVSPSNLILLNRRGCVDQLPGTAGSESEPCSLGPWDAERGAGVGRRRGFVLQAAELSRGEVQVRRPCFPLLAKHPCERGRHPLADTSSDCSIRAGSNPASLTR